VAGLDDLGGQPGGPPEVTIDAAGLLEVRWPMGRPARVDLATVVFEQLVDDVNGGRRALNVLGEVAAALAKLTG
jgi:hypothetical protein